MDVGGTGVSDGSDFFGGVMDVDFGLSGVNVRLVTVGGNVRRGVEVTIGWIKQLLKTVLGQGIKE